MRATVIRDRKELDEHEHAICNTVYSIYYACLPRLLNVSFYWQRWLQFERGVLLVTIRTLIVCN